MALFLTCLFINILTPFAFKSESFGTFYYLDSNDSKQIGSFYFYTTSNFSLTLYGRIHLAFTGAFLNLFLTVFVGVTLNIVSVSLYGSYIKERRNKEEAYTRVAFNDVAADNDEQEVIKVAVVSEPKKMTRKEINKNRTERNMFKMALTLLYRFYQESFK